MWWIFYGDGSVFSHEDGSPFAAPRTDVQVIVNEYDCPSGYCLTYGKDYYYWDDGWWPTDLGGLHAWAQKCPPGQLQILWGENCPHFEEIRKKAIAHKRALIGASNG